jgi:hypothetical protein
MGVLAHGLENTILSSNLDNNQQQEIIPVQYKKCIAVHLGDLSAIQTIYPNCYMRGLGIT